MKCSRCGKESESPAVTVRIKIRTKQENREVISFPALCLSCEKSFLSWFKICDEISPCFYQCKNPFEKLK